MPQPPSDAAEPARALSGGNTSGGNASGGNASGGSTSGGNTSGSNLSGGSTSGGNPSGSNLSGGNPSRLARRIAVAIIGGTVLLLGVVMLVTPGPGLAVIIGGLAILAAEFAFARRWLAQVKETGKLFVRRIRGQRDDNPRPPPQ